MEKITVDDFIENVTSLTAHGIEINKEEIKKSWDIVKAECECAHPDVRVLYSMARRIEDRQRSINEAEARICALVSVKKVMEVEK